jgi:hypothetical protein
VKKSNAALRKPPAAVNPAVVDEFVQAGSADVQTSGRSAMPSVGEKITKGNPVPANIQTSRGFDVQRAKRSVVERKDGRTLKRMTVYLPADLAKRLARHCLEHEQDMSEVIAASVSRTLGRSEA